MTPNKINLIRLTAETGLIKSGAARPTDLFNFCLDQNPNPDILGTLDYTDEDLAEARTWLASKKNTCRKVEGFAGSFYAVEAYGLEYYEVDEDGDLIEGSDYDAAEDAPGEV